MGVKKKELPLGREDLKKARDENDWVGSFSDKKRDEVRQDRDGLWYLTRGNSDASGWKLLVPQKLREAILEQCHATPWAGHRG